MNFTPGPLDVICAPGKEARNHSGNINFRTIIFKKLQDYSKASSKLEKSLIVSSIVDKIRRDSPNGGFVKFNSQTGEWYEVGDHLAREKVGQSFRDSLSSQYRSSTKAKKRRRKEEVTKLDNEVGEFVQTNCRGISNRIKLVSSHCRKEADIQRLFDQANADLLGVLKENEERRTKKRKFEHNTDDIELFNIADFEPVPLGQAFEKVYFSSFTPASISSF